MAGSRPFHIGLTMAGAVSAGAYTAGVLDFLFEALTEWQNAKDRGDPGVPQHDVAISVISGASAGGITGALAVLAASRGAEERTEKALNAVPRAGEKSPDDKGTVRCVLPTLYDSWIKAPQLFATSPGQKTALLGVNDVAAKSGIPSLLDCTLLDEIAEKALSCVRTPAQTSPFLTNPLHLFLTLTNLDGMHYLVGSETMIVHGDRAHFAINGLGGRPFPSAECRWLELWQDQGYALDFSRPLGAEDKSRLKEAVLATAAYPFGLKPRRIAASARDYDCRAWPIDSFTGPWEERPIRPAWPREEEEAGVERALNFVTVDGGAVDNEPFSYARYTIRRLPEKNPRGPEEADRAVIMIDPFPDLPLLHLKRLEGDRAKDLTLTHVLGALLPALVNQARFNLADLKDADDPTTFSRFLISPRRVKRRADGEKRRPIRLRPDLASEVFEAFGGFLDERFREHDFQLGRRNCQQFLKRQFVLHKSNPVFTDAFRSDDVDASYKLARPRSKRDDDTGAADRQVGEFRPIIPLVGKARDPCREPPWPALPEGQLKALERALGARIDGLVGELVREQISSRIARWVARRVWSHYRRRSKLANGVRLSVESSLYWNDQIAWEGNLQLTNPKEAAVFGALADPRYDFRTVSGIRREYESRRKQKDSDEASLSEEEISATLAKFKKRVVRSPSRRRKKPYGYTLRRRRPELAWWFRRIFASARGSTFDDDPLGA